MFRKHPKFVCGPSLLATRLRRAVDEPQKINKNIDKIEPNIKQKMVPSKCFEQSAKNLKK